MKYLMKSDLLYVGLTLVTREGQGGVGVDNKGWCGRGWHAGASEQESTWDATWRDVTHLISSTSAFFSLARK